MNTQIKTLASFIASAVWADGVYEESEKDAVLGIASALEIDGKELLSEVETAIEAVKEMDEAAMAKFLVSAALDVDEAESEMVYEVALEMVLSDGYLAESEVAFLLTIASALDVADSRAVVMLANKVKEETNLEVQL